jgi:hypothetical protein
MDPVISHLDEVYNFKIDLFLYDPSNIIYNIIIFKIFISLQTINPCMQ